MEEKKKFNLMVIFSLIVAIINIVFYIGWLAIKQTKNINVCFIIMTIIALISLIMAIVGVVQIRKKNQKGKVLGIIMIVVSAFGFILFGLDAAVYSSLNNQEFVDSYVCPQVTKCEVKDDKLSTCYFVEDLEVKCTTENLKESQFK